MTTDPTKRLVIITIVAVALIVLVGAAVYWSLRPVDPAERLVAELRAACEKPGPIERWLVQHQILKKHRHGYPSGIAADLAKLGKAAVPALVKALADKNAEVQSHAALALGYLGPDAKEGLSALVKALGDEEAKVRESAASTLGMIHPAAKEVVPALAKTLGDTNADVRRRAAKALSEIGPDAKQAVPTLVWALGDKDAHVRWEAAWALGQIGVDAVPAIVKALDDEQANVREYAAQALGCIGRDARGSVSTLIRALGDKDAHVRGGLRGRCARSARTRRRVCPHL